MIKDEGISTASQSRASTLPLQGQAPPMSWPALLGKIGCGSFLPPHASEGYYRLMNEPAENDVYCELAERHIQQIVLFHEEGEEGGKVRRITNEGKILEQPLDPALIPKLMSFLKLEKGKFGMVLLKKTLQVEERYPYPVRLEAMYEVTVRVVARVAVVVVGRVVVLTVGRGVATVVVIGFLTVLVLVGWFAAPPLVPPSSLLLTLGHVHHQG